MSPEEKEKFSNLLPIAAMFLWNRTEANADRIDMNNKIDANMKENKQLIDAIHQEIKDFHGRLCALEGRNRK